MSRRVVVGFSGGVTSAWCAGWALDHYPREEVILLWHDTKEEHPDTYRFIREMSAALGVPVTERSDGRSVTEVFRDEGFLGNNQNAMCSRILKQEQGDRFIEELKAQGHSVVRVFGFSRLEVDRMQRMVALGWSRGFTPRFPVAEQALEKQECADWCVAQGVQPSAMYCWSEHANCPGCVKGGRDYWLKVHKHMPPVFEQRADMEEEFGHTILRGDIRKSDPIGPDGRPRHPFLRELVQIGLQRTVKPREAINLGACECGD